MPWTPSASRPAAWAPFPPNQLFRASLLVIASVTSRPRGRDNPRQAKRSHRYPAKAADPAKRKKPRGPFTLVMLPLPVPRRPLN
jgi:hypothetical protein